MSREPGGNEPKGPGKSQVEGSEGQPKGEPAFGEVTNFDEVADRLHLAELNDWPIGDGAGGTSTVAQVREQIGMVLYSAYSREDQRGKPNTADELSQLADLAGIPSGGGLREAVVRLMSGMSAAELKQESSRPEFAGPSVTRIPAPGRERDEHMILAAEDNPAQQALEDFNASEQPQQ